MATRELQVDVDLVSLSLDRGAPVRDAGRHLVRTPRLNSADDMCKLNTRTTGRSVRGPGPDRAARAHECNQRFGLVNHVTGDSHEGG
jgi:hypothetical protein